MHNESFRFPHLLVMIAKHSIKHAESATNRFSDSIRRTMKRAPTFRRRAAVPAGVLSILLYAASQPWDALVAAGFAAVGPPPLHMLRPMALHAVVEAPRRATEMTESPTLSHMAVVEQVHRDTPEITEPRVLIDNVKRVHQPSKALGTKKKHTHGVLSPFVRMAKHMVGDQKLNQIRGQVISLHSNVIDRFVQTYDSAVGSAVLKAIFELADRDHNGKVDADELAEAVHALGFSWLQDKQVQGIVQRADADGDGALNYEEWFQEMPKLLRTNLIKLAKKNGGDLGLLV
jgi:hypothetical protein